MEFVSATGASFLSTTLAAIVYLCYRRLTTSRCAIHSPWLTCESSDHQERKKIAKIEMIKSAITETMNTLHTNPHENVNGIELDKQRDSSPELEIL